jgi:hypothetical protein
MTGTVIKLPGVSGLPATKDYAELKSTMETVLLSRAGIEEWKHPPFQRPLKVNDKVEAVSKQIQADGGVIPDVITIAILGKEKFLLDGQHRIKAFLMTELPEAIADIRMIRCESMAEMGQVFERINDRLVPLKTDDRLRSLEPSYKSLQTIRARCPFIGYDQIRRGPHSPIVSMSLAIRAWMGSLQDVPSGSTSSAKAHLENLDPEETNRMIHFFTVVHSAWRNDPEYRRCWTGLNLTIAAWLWRRCVLSQSSPRVTKLTPDQFGQGMLALTADKTYLDWLVGRNLNDRERSPCYNRMKAIVSRRLFGDIGKKVLLPSPPWASSSG